jgi:hypothetical protein
LSCNGLATTGMIEMKFLALFSLSSPPPSSPLPFSLSPFPLLLLFRHYSAKIAPAGNELRGVAIGIFLRSDGRSVRNLGLDMFQNPDISEFPNACSFIKEHPDGPNAFGCSFASGWSG